jgi:hypothetical protein
MRRVLCFKAQTVVVIDIRARHGATAVPSSIGFSLGRLRWYRGSTKHHDKITTCRPHQNCHVSRSDRKQSYHASIFARERCVAAASGLTAPRASGGAKHRLANTMTSDKASIWTLLLLLRKTTLISAMRPEETASCLPHIASISRQFCTTSPKESGPTTSTQPVEWNGNTIAPY